MNVENILKVATAIETHSIENLGFNMSDFLNVQKNRLGFYDHSGHHCNTTTCIGGWAHHIRLGLTQPSEYRLIDPNIEAEWLGLDSNQMAALFYVHNGYYTLSDVPDNVAVRCLRNLAATGKVDWNTAFDEEGFDSEKLEALRDKISQYYIEQGDEEDDDGNYAED